jgi:GT2 family glycosyltransferase
VSAPRELLHSQERTPVARGDESLARATDHVEPYVALLRREQQLDAIQRSLGWRVLSYYGPYKRRFVAPAWRRLSRLLAQWVRGSAEPEGHPYAAWARFAERVHAHEAADRSTLVSLVLITDARSRAACASAIAAILAQRHAAWELVVASVGDGERLDAVVTDALQDPRIRWEPARYPTRAAAFNALVPHLRGEIVALVPPEVTLATNALSVVARTFADAASDVVYTDEDAQDRGGRRFAPRFNPGWSPDLLLSRMYWSHVAYYRHAILMRALPLAEDTGGADRYDCALRVTEQAVNVTHIPRLLAHVDLEVGAPDEASAATAAEQRVLEAALARRGIEATVRSHGAGAYRVQRAIRAPARVSVVIPTRDGLTMLRRCLDAVERTDHPDFEIVIVDNGSRADAMLAFLAATPHRVLRAPGPFNFSRLNNGAVRETSGRHLVFLNDDTEPCDPGWLRSLEEHAQRPEVGAVGAKLLYPDGRIQHAGIAVGIGDLAGHPFRFRRQDEAPDETRNVSAVTAACLMMRRECFDAVGGFDERLPVNSNDVDLCLRLRARGYLVVYTPHAILRHFESQTRGARALPDDAWLMTRRWRDVLRGDPYYSPNLVLAEETGDPDLSKPDGMVRLYDGPPTADGTLVLGPGENAGQPFFAIGPHLAAIVVRAVVTGATPERALTLRVSEAPDNPTAVRTVRTATRGRGDDEWWFCFEPIAGSADRFWYFRVEVAEGHTVVLQRRSVPSEVMGPCFENDVPAHGTLRFQVYARAPERSATTA